MAPFPPGKGGGEGVARGGKGKGILIHTLTDGHGMPVAHRTTPANGDERAQVLPLLDAVKVHTGKRGRPRKRLHVLATDKGYAAQALRQTLRKRGIRAQIPKRVWQTKKPRGRPIKQVVARFQAERTFAWFQKKYRRLVVRWERLVACFEAFLAIATIHIWMHRLIVGYIHETAPPMDEEVSAGDPWRPFLTLALLAQRHSACLSALGVLGACIRHSCAPGRTAIFVVPVGTPGTVAGSMP